jgi:DNA-binding XRE family transcriptional regulator
MNIPTNHQVITHQGVPVAVVVPFDEYSAAFAGITVQEASVQEAKKPTVPHEVAFRVLKERISPIRAWREYLGLTQAEVAACMDVSQSAFAQVEAMEGKPRMNTLKKVAAALELVPEQIKW